MFEKIKSSIKEEDMYVKSAMGVKFEHYENRGVICYRIGKVNFEVVGNVRGHGGGMDGYYWDNLEATPVELDKLHVAYLTHPKLIKNGGSITLNRDNGQIKIN